MRLDRPSAARRAPARPSGALLVAVALGLFGLACQPSIGDRCVLSTDCSQRGDRLCDTSQPDGYCTVFNCAPNGCPTEAACVVFGGRIPGCGYSDRSIARTARTFCARTCERDADCRAGYSCRDPRDGALRGIVLDDVQAARVCLPMEGLQPCQTDRDCGDGYACQLVARSPLPYDSGLPERACTPLLTPTPPSSAAVCSSSGPPAADGGAPDGAAPDASTPDAAPRDASPDGAADAGDASTEGGPRDAAADGG